MKIREYSTAGLSEMKIFPLPCCRHPFMSGSKWAVSAKLKTKLAWKECQVFPGVSFCLASFSWHRKGKWVRSWALKTKHEVWVYKQVYITFYYGILSTSPYFEADASIFFNCRTGNVHVIVRISLKQVQCFADKCLHDATPKRRIYFL